MKTFSIALGSYVVSDAGALTAGAGSLQVLGGPPEDINTKEARDARAALDLTRLLAEEATETGPEVEGEAVPPPEVKALHVEAGDTLEFGVDGDDYSTCVLTAHHPDGSKDWIKWHRNAFVTGTGWSPAPPPPELPPEEPVTEMVPAGETVEETVEETGEEPVSEEEYSSPPNKRGRNRY